MAIHGFHWKYMSLHLIVEKANWFELVVEIHKYGADFAFGAFGITFHMAFGWK